MSRPSTYNIGSAICLLISVGSAAIAYGGGFLPFVPLNLLAWILGPLGVYTLVFAFTHAERSSYLSWGVILVAIAVASAVYNVIHPVVVFGVLLIVLAVIGLSAYFKQTPKANL